MVNGFVYYNLVSTIHIHYLSIYLEIDTADGEVYWIQHYVITYVWELVRGFLRVFRFPPSIKMPFHDITETMLIVALNAIALSLTLICELC